MSLQTEIQHAITITVALGQAILKAGLRAIPSGHLYAMVMEKVDIETYTKCINLLKDKGLVSEKFNLLKWEAK